MSIKLLSKQEITAKKSIERGIEIQEGLKLAKKVDLLRETVVNEESALKKFRIETLSRINEEIVRANDLLNSLKLEISRLEERKEIALSPLDIEWKKIKDKEDLLIEREKVLTDINLQNNDRNSDLDSREEKINRGEKKVTLLILETERRINELEDLKRNVETRRSEISKKENSILKKERELESQKNLLLENSKIQEKIYEEKKLENEKERQRLMQKEIQLVDREETLARNIKRISK